MPTASCLLKHFDAFGWVPTIRGALSLDLFQSAINNIGDVDKHSVAFRKYDGQRKEFYLAATSLETTVDRKYKKKYAKTFRTFFTGVINNCEQTYQSISDIASDDEASSFISEHTALFGKVTIVVEVKNKISDKEREAIEKIRSLADLYGDYRKQYSIDTVPFEEIDKTRGKMLELWKEYKADVESIAEDPNFIVYNFEVVLLRSGLLFIKDINSDCRIKDYAEPRTVADYRTNTPLPRIFKYVMNYVKYLFHANYHHNQKHDTYLPASNLHPLRNGNVTSFDRVFQHQIDSFLNPIVRMKRKDFSDNAINPVGVILYAKSFVNICFTHGLISEDLKDNTLAHLEIQEDEINEMTGFRKSFLNSMLTKGNLIFALSWILAAGVAILKIYSTYATLHKSISEDPGATGGSGLWSYVTTLVIIFGVCFFVFTSWILYYRIKRFRRRSGLGLIQRIMFRNSRLDENRYSYNYKAYIGLSNLILSLTVKKFLYIWLIICGAILAFLVYVYWVLMSLPIAGY